ncbi:hypothetical protein BDB01DRAFT_847868 [Pilobolus umbonatus]|nr:hypothetical protein BDB01DRAFT_847868 [Pilobolus umbonatus]
MFKFLAVFLLAILSVVSAIVINPVITTPNSRTKWRAGESYVVQWDTTYNDGTQIVPIPEMYKGTLKLGYFEGDDQYNEHLYWDLASGFNLNAGAYRITLPADLPTRTSYIVVLMGNSGNASARFTIRAARDTSA